MSVGYGNIRPLDTRSQNEGMGGQMGEAQMGSKVVKSSVRFRCGVVKEMELPLVGNVRVQRVLVLLCW